MGDYGFFGDVVVIWPDMKTFFTQNWLKLLAIVLILGAVQPFLSLPFAYYQIMNWVVVGASILSAKMADRFSRPFLTWLFIFIAVIFNPIAPIYLRADVWQITDLVTALIFAFSLVFLKGKR